MAMLTNDIYIGSVANPLYHFQLKQIREEAPQGTFALDPIGNNLSVDTFDIPIRYGASALLYQLSGGKIYKLQGNQLYALKKADAKDFLKDVPYGTPVWWYVAGDFYAKGYLKSSPRVAKYDFKLTCTSGVGLLDTPTHVGGLYTAAAITDVLSSIIGDAFTYSVSEAVQASRVYGRLPYDTCRNNLHRLLFATGAALTKGDDETDYVIDYLSDDVTDLPASRIALQGSVDYQLPSNKVEVTEHAYFESSAAVAETLFDNTLDTPVTNLTVIFSGPVYDLAYTSGLTVSESGVNYAVVSGQGVLTGKYYTHTTQLMVISNNPNGEPERVRRVTDNELVTVLNSRNVARRVLSFYQSAKTVKAKILLEDEKCGSVLRFTDAFGDVTQAILTRMDTLVTSVIGATCQLVEGYQPGNNGNNYLHREAITQSGTWTVPLDIPVDEDGKATIRIALIAAGDGGQGGSDGANGSAALTQFSNYWEGWGAGDYRDIYASANQPLPSGGAAGVKGSQGKVYVFEARVWPGEVLDFNIGAGGIGGARTGGAGGIGGPTTVSSTSIGSASSASGLLTQGYYDPFTGDVLATPAADGIRGGDGGQTDTESLYAQSYAAGRSGGNAGAFSGGTGGAGGHAEKTDTVHVSGVPYSIEYTFIVDAPGGGGGGAAYGEKGSNGGSPTIVRAGDTYAYWNVTTGSGGNGGNASAPQKPTFGCGGAGGNGGGGGGNIGGAYREWHQATGSITYGTPGKGGKGSVGGDGGDGLGIVYW